MASLSVILPNHPEQEDATPNVSSNTGESAAKSPNKVALSPVNRWVIQSRNKFLQTYSNHGIRFTEELPKARLFHSAGVAKSAALILGLDRIQRVLVDADGSNVRIALTHNPSSFSFSPAERRLNAE